MSRPGSLSENSIASTDPTLQQGLPICSVRLTINNNVTCPIAEINIFLLFLLFTGICPTHLPIEILAKSKVFAPLTFLSKH